ncbi:MAG: SGNH/GDSL hydrolase family protein [Deltaproteobacteria bacterium]|nr:SGNH/GDSL hydrolase family protein [Deltaproteobacteria bacterium]
MYKRISTFGLFVSYPRARRSVRNTACIFDGMTIALFVLTMAGCDTEPTKSDFETVSTSDTGTAVAATGSGDASGAAVGGTTTSGTAGTTAVNPATGGNSTTGGNATAGGAGGTDASSSSDGAGGVVPVAGAGGAGGVVPDASAGDAGGVAPNAGAGGEENPADTCVKGEIKASEVVFVGTSVIAAGSILADTSALARQAGTINANESYRSYAVVGAQLIPNVGSPITPIPSQFMQAVAEGPVKVILMEGGINDLLWGGRCQNGYDPTCSEVVSTVDTLFAQMKTDGVTDVVYFFYPDPTGSGARIKDAMDVLRPEMKKACDEETDVRCVWVDQRESWEGHYDTYTFDGIHPTGAGSQAAANEIWAAMVANCIAQ